MKESGIYMIFNTITGDFYIGSTHRAFWYRWSNHKSALRKNKNGCVRLQRAWNKYGADAFAFLILEPISDKVNILQREQVYLDILKPVYNMCPTAGSPRLGEEPWNKGKRTEKLCTCGKPRKERYNKEGRFKKYDVTCGDQECQLTKQRQWAKANPEHYATMRKETVKFSVISPSGEVYHSENALRFCKEHNLVYTNFFSMLSGRVKSSQKWKLYNEQ